jgi:MFS family permease
MQVKRADSWHVLLATWFGMVFDGMDTTIYILTLYPCLSELLHTTSHSSIAATGSLLIGLFLCGWAVGSIIFGVMADYIGRVKTLLFTLILYAVCTGLCAFCHHWEHLAVLRFLVGVGIGGEASIGGVLVAESWTGRSRLHMTGVLQSGFPAGVLLLALVNLAIGHIGWRILYIVGTIPALLAFYIRFGLKEPEHASLVQAYRRELKKKPLNQLSKHEQDFLSFTFLDLFRPPHRAKVSVVLLLALTACIGYYSVLSWIPAWINQLTGTAAVNERSMALIAQTIGGMIGALSGGFIVSRLGRSGAFQFIFTTALIASLGLFLTVKTFSPALLAITCLTGFACTAPFTYLFIYVPELFSTRLRATAFSFSIQAARILAGVVAVCGGQLVGFFGGSYAMAAAAMSSIYVLGFFTTFFMPKTSEHLMHEDILPAASERDLVSTEV